MVRTALHTLELISDMVPVDTEHDTWAVVAADIFMFSVAFTALSLVPFFSPIGDRTQGHVHAQQVFKYRAPTILTASLIHNF